MVINHLGEGMLFCLPLAPHPLVATGEWNRAMKGIWRDYYPGASEAAIVRVEKDHVTIL